MSGYPVPLRQGEKVCEGGEWQGSWVLFTELKASTPLFRPQNGSIILYNRKKVKYRKDGYLWKKRKDGKTTREDHMKLKVQGMEVREASDSSALAHLSLPSAGFHSCQGLVPLSPHHPPFSLTLYQLADSLAHPPYPISLHVPSLQALGHASPGEHQCPVPSPLLHFPQGSQY